jgi:Na+-driven multidrug efflux pump
MFFFPRELALLMLNGEESVSLVVEFLPICGIMIWGVDSLFVFRNGCQGMGKPLIPMISGVAEMVMRIAAIVLLVDVVGFKATAYAEVAAWMIALTMNFLAFEWNLRKEMKGTCSKKSVAGKINFRVKERVKV